MAALSEYTNVYNTALLILQKKGYRLSYDSGTEDYCAEKEGWDFRSPTPCGLLGLVGIFEFKQPSARTEYWWREDGPDLYRELSPRLEGDEPPER